MNEDVKQKEVETIKEPKLAASNHRPWLPGSTSLPSVTTTPARCTASGSLRPSIPRNWLSRCRPC